MDSIVSVGCRHASRTFLTATIAALTAILSLIVGLVT